MLLPLCGLAWPCLYSSKHPDKGALESAPFLVDPNTLGQCVTFVPHFRACHVVDPLFPWGKGISLLSLCCTTMDIFPLLPSPFIPYDI